MDHRTEADDLAPTTGSDEAACDVCAYAARESWWGPGRTHHNTCHRTWSSLAEGHCVVCCNHFANVKAFDAHLGPDGCRPPAEILRKDGRPRLTPRLSKWGTTWRFRPEFAKATPSEQ